MEKMDIVKNIFFIIGVWSFINWTYLLQLKWGNWLYKNHNKSWIRKIWWSEYDFYRNFLEEQKIIEDMWIMYEKKIKNGYQ